MCLPVSETWRVAGSVGFLCRESVGWADMRTVFWVTEAIRVVTGGWSEKGLFLGLRGRRERWGCLGRALLRERDNLMVVRA